MNRNELLKLAGFSDEFIKTLDEFSRDVPEIVVPEFSLGDEAVAGTGSGSLVVSKPRILASSTMIVRHGRTSA